MEVPRAESERFIFKMRGGARDDAGVKNVPCSLLLLERSAWVRWDPKIV